MNKILTSIFGADDQTLPVTALNDKKAIVIWLKEHEKTTNTFVAYKQAAERFYMWLSYHNLTLLNTTREIALNFATFLRNPQPADLWCGPAVAKEHKNWKPFIKGLGNKSIHLCLANLAVMFDYLIDSGYLKSNPFRKLRLHVPTTPLAPIENYLTPKEFQNYVLAYVAKMPRITEKATFEYYRAKWVFNFLFATGCRRSELMNARMSDFIQQNDQWWLKVQSMDNVIEIPITEEIMTCLAEYRQAHNMSPLPNQSEIHIGLVFNVRNMKSVKDDSLINKMIKKICTAIADEIRKDDPGQATKFYKVSSNWFKHSSTFAQLESGIPLEVVQRNQRHSNIETTIRYQRQEADFQYNETNNKFKVQVINIGFMPLQSNLVFIDP